MSEAPKHVWLSPCETVNNKESWIDELRASHLDSYVDDSCEGVQYIRADQADAVTRRALILMLEGIKKAALDTGYGHWALREIFYPAVDDYICKEKEG